MNNTQILSGDWMNILQALPAESVQCVVTSPPYWGLRDYGIEGQLGLESTPREYVAKLVEGFREVWRALRDNGTLWLNLGDSYTSGGRATRSPGRSTLHPAQPKGMKRPNTPTGLKPKDLVGIPWRVALALQADGWWLRSDIIWSKPNPMPESVRDRPTKAHEYIFLLSKSERYFYDADAIREGARYGFCEGGFRASGRYKNQCRGQDNNQQSGENVTVTPGDGGTRNKRTVWEIATQPYPDAHFAVFPEALVEPCVLAGTSAKGQCPECGAPWERLTDREYRPMTDRSPDKLMRRPESLDPSSGWGGSKKGYVDVMTVGWQPTCDCHINPETGEANEPLPPVPQTVLDPFAGAGTTGVVASKFGRRFIGIELNPEYAAMARKRIAQTQPALFPAGMS